MLTASALLLIVGAVLPPSRAGSPGPRIFLPLLFSPGPTPGPGGWITILDEGFEAQPDPLWRFFDDSGAPGAFSWPGRTCRPHAGSYSAWAVGGGTGGAALPCGSDYPDNVTSYMTYGPFSLAGAGMAELRFQLWLDRLTEDEEFCWQATDGVTAGAACLNAGPGGWTPITVDLADVDAAEPGVSMLGKSRVWITFRFMSDGAGHAAEGAYVDDVVIRTCRDLTCTPVAAAGRAASARRGALAK